jgi:hypothetical protein
MRELTCDTCGKRFTVYNRGTPRYCSIECKKEKHMERKKTRNKVRVITQRRKRLPEVLRAIGDINRQAYEEGLSYGKFVAKYGL